MKQENFEEYNFGGLRFATLFEPKPGATRLCVVLNAFADRIDHYPPIFHAWPTAGEVDGHVLRISDPTLFLSDVLKGSCWLGTEFANPVPSVVQIARGIGRRLGLDRKDIIFFGGSGSGFGALQCAILDGVSIGLAFNPVIDIGAYAGNGFVEFCAQTFRPDTGIARLANEFSERFSIVAALRDAHRRGRRPQLGLLQNVTDRTHFDSHYGTFCRAFNIPLTGGTDPSGRLRCATFDKRGGHGVNPDSWEIVETLLAGLGQEATRGLAPGMG